MTPQRGVVVGGSEWPTRKAAAFGAVMEEVYGRMQAEAMLEHLTKLIKSEASELIQSRPDLSYTVSGM